MEEKGKGEVRRFIIRTTKRDGTFLWRPALETHRRSALLRRNSYGTFSQEGQVQSAADRRAEQRV